MSASRIQKDHLDAALDLPPHQRPEGIFARTESSSDSLQRWCGWLDAVIHLRAHSLFKLAPELFDPAANKNAATAILTADIPNLPKKAAVNSPAWIWHPGMPRIAAPALLHELSRGVTHDPWPFRQLDTLLILLFPLATHYQWNFAGLADLLRAHLRRSEPYPCWSPRELEAYCTHTLGLHGLSLEGPSNSRQLPGCNLALKICRPPAPGLGNPPWS
jgi:hypothetical protein